MDDKELREQVTEIIALMPLETGAELTEIGWERYGENEQEAIEKMLQLIKARDAAVRIDEDENWLRFVGAAWDAEPVTANDLHKRIKELRRESDLGRPKDS